MELRQGLKTELQPYLQTYRSQDMFHIYFGGDDNGVLVWPLNGVSQLNRKKGSRRGVQKLPQLPFAKRSGKSGGDHPSLYEVTKPTEVRE